MSTTAYCCYNLTNFTKPLIEHQSGSGSYIAKIISFVFGIFSLMLPNYNYAVENLLCLIVTFTAKIGLVVMLVKNLEDVCKAVPYALGGLLCVMTLFSYDLHTALDIFNKAVFDLTKLTYSQESIDRMFYILYCVLFQVYVMCLMRMFNSSRLLKKRALEVEEKLKLDQEKIEKRLKFIAERKMEWELPVLIKLGKLIQKMSLKISGKYTHIVGKCSCHIQYLEERWLTYPFQPNGDCVNCCFDKTIHMISQDMDQRYYKEWDIILSEFGYRRKLDRRPPLLVRTTCLSSNYSAAQSKKEYDYSIKHQHNKFSTIANAVFPNNNEIGGLTLIFTDLEPLDDNEMKKCSSSKDNKKDYDSSSGSEGSDGSDNGRGESKGRHGNAGGGGAAGDGGRNEGTKTSSFTPGNNLERSNTNLNQFRLSVQLAKMNKKIISQCESNESIQQEEHWMEIIQQEDSLLSPNDHVTKMHSLGMTIEALVEFAYAHDCWELPTWKVVDDIIKPATKKTRCRYGDLPEMKECFGPAAVYMTHCWGAKFGDLIGAACHGASKDRIVWIDIFAVRQWPGNVADKRDLNFLKLISKCETLVVSTSPVAGLKTFMTDPQERDAFLASLEGQVAKKLIPFLHLWCIREIVAAIKLYVPIVVKFGSVLNTNGSWKYDTLCAGELMKNIQHMIDVESSECAVQADKDREISFLRSLDGGVNGINTLIAGLLSDASSSQIPHELEIEEIEEIEDNDMKEEQKQIAPESVNNNSNTTNAVSTTSAAPENPLLAAIRKAEFSGLKKIDRAQLEEDQAEAGAGKGGIANGMMGSIAAIMAQRNTRKAIKTESSDDDSDNDDWSDSD